MNEARRTCRRAPATKLARTLAGSLRNVVRELATCGLITVGIAMVGIAGGLAALPQDELQADEIDTSAATDGVFSLPRSQDAIAVWLEARALVRTGKAERAAERLAQLWMDGPRGVVPVPEAADRWQGVRRALCTSLRDLPPAGRQRYEERVRRFLGTDAETPLHEFSRDELRRLASAWPASRFAIAARLRLGDLALAEGDGRGAQQHYRAARDAMTAGDPRRAGLADRDRAAAALAAVADGRPLRSVLDGNDPLLGELRDTVADGTPGPWPGFGGGGDGTRRMQPPLGETLQYFDVPIEAVGFEGNPLAMHATGDLEGVYIDDGHSVYAIDPVTRQLAWSFAGPIHRTQHDYDTREAINKDLLLSCAVSDELVIACLQVPHDIVGAAETQRFRQSISIIQKIPARRLFAFERQTGKVRWSHWDFEGGPISERFNAHDASGAPLVVGDTVLCPTHTQTGAIAYYVSAYDLHTGEPRWRRHICSSQQEVNMFGNANQEFAAGPLAVRGGVVFGTTNLGVCFAVDLEDGDLRWISGYETIPLPRTQLRNQERRPVFFANNPIVVAGGVMATTPLDSEYVVAFDCETGAMQWELRHDQVRDAPIRWLLGAIDDRFVLSGLGVLTVEPRPVRDGRPAWRVVADRDQLGESGYMLSDMPRGAIDAGDNIHFVASDGSMRVLKIDGSRTSLRQRSPLRGAGNLLMVDGVAVACRAGDVRCFIDPSGLLQRTRKQLRERPGDAELLLRLATLLEARAEGRGQQEAAIAAYRDALTAARDTGLGPGSSLYERIASGLFEALFKTARDVAATDPAGGAVLLERARDAATVESDWLRAQLALLDLVEGKRRKHLEELRRLADTYGNSSWTFPSYGRVPVIVWAQWSMLDDLESPPEQVELAWQLAERHGAVSLGPRTVRSLCNERIAEWIEQHGQKIYASIEARAEVDLQNAGEDLDLLRAVAHRFVHSASAEVASVRLLDAAVRTGDLATAASAFAESVRGRAARTGALRRLAAAAEAGGNAALHYALGKRLIRDAGAESSDYGPDAGQPYRTVFANLVAVPRRETPPLQRPIDTLCELEAPSRQSSLTYIPLRLAPGFPAPKHLPMMVAVDDDLLAAFPTEKLPQSFEDRTWTLSIETRPQPPLGDLLLCGDVIVLAEPSRLRGLSADAGRVLWQVDAPPQHRFLGTLGVHQGVLHAYAMPLRRSSGGGQLIGVEPIGGTSLFATDLTAGRPSVPPLASAERLWSLDVPPAQDGQPLILGHDPIDGRLTRRVPIGGDVLEALGLGDDDRRRLREPMVQASMACDGERLYLTVPKENRGEEDRGVAINLRDGSLSWAWRGDPEMKFNGLWLGPEQVIIWQRSVPSSSVTLLDPVTGKTLDRVPLAGRARVMRAASARQDQGQGFGDELLIADRPGGWRLTLLGLRDGVRAFRQEHGAISRLLPEPLVGEDFLAVPVQQGREPVLRVVQRDSRMTGALPDGRSAITLGDQPPLKFYDHDGMVVVESLSGLRLLGIGR